MLTIISDFDLIIDLLLRYVDYQVPKLTLVPVASEYNAISYVINFSH